jgi:lipoprotein-anchoring transpeptidase ErfK/SrfK
MRSTGKHASAPAARYPARLGVTTAVVALVAVMGIIAAVASDPAAARPGGRPVPSQAAPVTAVSAVTGWNRLPGVGSSAAAPARRVTMPLLLTGADRRDCPAAAAACVDLTRHITWLQANGKLAFGPVKMEPGEPGSKHQTPRGTFRVSWKGGPSMMSNIYNEPMPWATFFAPGGIAFHGGSLTTWSHGCVHLTVENAHYYNEHLPIGAEVVVF